MAAALQLVVTAIGWAAVLAGLVGAGLIIAGLIAALGGNRIEWMGEGARSDIGPTGFGFALVGWLLLTGGIAYVCILLRRILATLAMGDPFVPQNADRLTRLAIALAFIEGASLALQLAMHRFAGIGLGLRMDLAIWGAILILLILSQVFREGARLRMEDKLTV